MKKEILILVVVALISGFFIFNISQTVDQPEEEIKTDGVVENYFQCEDENLKAVFNNDEEYVELSWGDEKEVIGDQVEIDGEKRYESEEGIIFWIQGEKAFLEEDGNALLNNCSIQEKEIEEDNYQVDDNLIGKWKWEKTIYSNGEEITPSEDDFILTLSEDGSMTATTDCNNISGNFRAAGNMIEFSNPIMTKMYCEDSLEDEFVKVLNTADDYLFEEDTLTITLNEDIINGDASVIFSSVN